VLELVALWASVRSLLLESRRLLKMMGENAGVAIEPDEQTQLADDTMGLPGVVAAGVSHHGVLSLGNPVLTNNQLLPSLHNFIFSSLVFYFVQVPGAGGVDAIFALTLGPYSRPAVEGLWAAWAQRTVCPLMLTAQGASDPAPGIRTESSLGWD
jgi:phosphomevalonate kinase